MKQMMVMGAAGAMAALIVPGYAWSAEPGGEKVNQLIVYGSDVCPPSTDDQITVCARKGEGERFRIPEDLRDDPNAATNRSWTDRVKAYETVGATGINSCSATGSGGASGCMAQLIHAAYAERKQSSNIRFGKLIDAERSKRLQSVDSDAAAEQTRVESLEKAYDAKLAKERASGDVPSGAAPAQTLNAPPADSGSAGHQ